MQALWRVAKIAFSKITETLFPIPLDNLQCYFDSTHQEGRVCVPLLESGKNFVVETMYSF